MIEVNNLSKIYNGRAVVNNISFEIREKEIIGLLGPNGAGKTTTILMLLGLVNPDSGEVIIDSDSKMKNNDIVYLPDNPICYEELTVEENLIFVSKLYNRDKNELYKVINRLQLNEHTKSSLKIYLREINRNYL